MKFKYLLCRKTVLFIVFLFDALGNLANMDLLLIQPAPPSDYGNDALRFISNFARRNYLGIPPLSLGIIAALTPPDWNVTILQEPADQITFDEKADLVGITAVTHIVKRGYEIADKFRKRGIKVIMGGIHPTVMYEEALQHCDAVCIGEAESIWKNVLEDLQKGHLKKIYKAEYYFDFNHYVSPRRDLMSTSGPFFYSAETVEASRGCPYDCDFCSVALAHGKKIRYRQPSSIISEIEKIRKKRIFFVDNNIIANKQKAQEMFLAMAPLKKNWTAQATISIADDIELVKAAADAGCYGLLIGIENVTDEGLQKYQKSKKSFEALRKSVKIIKDHGIAVLAHMIFGNDFETKESLKITLERLNHLDVASASLGILVPYPGTRIAENLEKQNRILTKDWNMYDVHHLVFSPARFSPEEFIEEIHFIRKEFFAYRKILSRTIHYRNPAIFGFNLSTRSHNRVGMAL